MQRKEHVAVVWVVVLLCAVARSPLLLLDHPDRVNERSGEDRGPSSSQHPNLAVASEERYPKQDAELRDALEPDA